MTNTEREWEMMTPQPNLRPAPTGTNLSNPALPNPLEKALLSGTSCQRPGSLRLFDGVEPLMRKNNLTPTYEANVTAFLDSFEKRHPVAEVIAMIESLRDLRVLVVGEAILDEYVYGTALGKSAKEPIVAIRYSHKEVHAGGSIAIANHLATFVDSVKLITYLGSVDSNEEFIRNSLAENIDVTFVYKPSSPTIVKRRFVETYQLSKMLEIYEMNDEPLAEAEEALLCEKLATVLPKSDIVIAADYGHGLITNNAIRLLCRQAPFLAVNTQINAANTGYHALSRYPRAHYACVHEGEIRLDQRDRTTNLTELIVKVAERMTCRSFMVTRGKAGCLLYHPDRGFSECPSLAMNVVDRVGAGDSVLAISSLCAGKGLPPDVTAFVSNVVGAQAVSTVGNRSPIQREKVIETIQSIIN